MEKKKEDVVGEEKGLTLIKFGAISLSRISDFAAKSKKKEISKKG